MTGVILTIFAGIVCLVRFHLSWQAAVAFLWLCMLIRIAIHDHATMEIPDHYNLILAGIGLVSMLPAFFDISAADRIAGMFVVSLPMFCTDLLIPGGFGGGDIKLMAAAGLFLGWRGSLLAAVLAFAAAGIYSIFLLVSRKAGRKDAFAFGPFLCAGLAFAALF